MSDEPIVTFDRVSKHYRLGRERSNARAAIPGSWGEPRGRDWFPALDDVSFTVGRGEAFGIVGPNGAGKSTALKILAGVITPSAGRVIRPARCVSIIELGVGFDPELTALENIDYGGALLGLTPAEIDDRRDGIIEFAELQDFATMPVKRYSTGMMARLGFALATSVEADLFLVDEVLSVGDWGFQRKSLERMRRLNAEGATIVFISHNLWIVNQLCDHALLLNHGRTVASGPAHNVLGAYLGMTPGLVTGANLMMAPAPDVAAPSADAVHHEAPEPPEAAHATDGAGEPAAAALELTEADAARPHFERPKVELLPAEVLFNPMEADGRPVAITDLRCEPKEFLPGEAMDLVGRIEVREPSPGLRLLVSCYWEGFAGFAVPDELPSEFLATPGLYEFRVHFLTITASPAIGTFQLAVVDDESPEDPEQLLPHAIERARADMRVLGELTPRPGVYFPRVFHLSRVEQSEVVEIQVEAGPGVPDNWRSTDG